MPPLLLCNRMVVVDSGYINITGGPGSIIRNHRADPLESGCQVRNQREFRLGRNVLSSGAVP